MKLTTGLFALVAGMAASGAFAQTASAPAVGAEKRASFDGLLPNAYGLFEVRHSTNRVMNEDEIVSTTPNLSIRPTLGSTFFSGKLDTSFTGVFTKDTNVEKFEKTALYNETFFKLWESANGSSFQPYAYIELPTEGTYVGNKNKAWVGFEAIGFLTLAENSAGKVELRGLMDHFGVFNIGDEKEMIDAENNTGNPKFSLTEGPTQDLMVVKRDPGMENSTEVGIRFKPAAVQGLLVALYTELGTDWAPKYNINADEQVEQDGYKVDKRTTNKFTLSYKINNTITVANSLFQTVDGYWEKGTDNKTTRWHNRLGVTATIF